jgi:hypothetical protein
MNQLVLALSALLLLSVQSSAGGLEKPAAKVPPVVVPPALRTAVPQSAGSCSSIRDHDLENACRSHLSRRATAAAGWWLKKH